MGDQPWRSYFRFVKFKNLFFHLIVIFGENLLSSFFSSTIKPKILQSFISSQLTTWFCHDFQKTSMPRTDSKSLYKSQCRSLLWFTRHMKWRPHLVTSQCRNGSPPNSIKGRHNQHNYHICIHKWLVPSQVQMPKVAVSGVVGLKAFYATVELCTSLDDHSTCIASTKEMKR